jgi:fermentation-respiration switch protein FrsA (DUF1100 family)
VKKNNALFIIVSLVLGIYLALVIGLYFFQRQIIYNPSESMPSPMEAGVPEMQELKVTSLDGNLLKFWYRPSYNNQPTIIFFHGNAGNLSDRSFKIKPYLDEGFGVLLVAYRGYGKNLGNPSEIGLYYDARAQLNYLKNLGVYPKDWILYGESLGTGVAVHMAFEMATNNKGGEILDPAAGLVLEAPFSSMPEIAQDHYPFIPARFMIWDQFNSISKISQIDIPVFIVHGQEDKVISFEHGKKLFQSANQPKQAKWIPLAGHNNLYDFGMAELVIDFIGKAKF